MMFSVFNILAAAFWFYLPAFVANSAPLLVARLASIQRINRPIWREGLGPNKTWIGFWGGMAAGVLVGVLQVSLTPWSHVHDVGFWVLWSAIISFGALLGDSAKSFFKRRIGIAPGASWPVFDGVDYVIGALVVGLLLFVPSWQLVVAMLVLGPVLSLCANIVSYAMGWKNVWY